MGHTSDCCEHCKDATPRQGEWHCPCPKGHGKPWTPGKVESRRDKLPRAKDKKK